MRHRVRTKKLSRDKSARGSMIISQAKTLLKTGKLRSTQARVKASSRFVDSLLSKVAKMEDRKGFLYLEKNLKDAKFADYVVKEVKPQLTDRATGFVSILKLENRKGDNSTMALARLLVNSEKSGKKDKKSNKSSKPDKKIKKSEKKSEKKEAKKK